MESTRMVAESMTASTKVFTARMDEMDKNLAAIKWLLKELMASLSKLAEDVQLLLVQAVLHNNQRHHQGQAAFHRVQDVENLVADFKGASATVTRALEESVPTSLKSVLGQTLPPTLQMILEDKISPTLQHVLGGTFSEFTSRYEMAGDKMVRKIRTTLASQREALTMDYSLVQASLQEVLTHLRTLDCTDDPSPPDRSDHGGGPSFSHVITISCAFWTS